MATSTSSLPTALDSLIQIHILLRDNATGYYDDAMDTYTSILNLHLWLMASASHRGLPDRGMRFYLAACWIKMRPRLAGWGAAVRRVDNMFTDRGWDFSLQELARLHWLEVEVGEGKEVVAPGEKGEGDDGGA
ncbi:hypothetical protein G7Y79_00036g072190 [Physcia stellaris]|nr:hypothetical protein G7Y79_00036g072190 [Physcia stellaris]